MPTTEFQQKLLVVVLCAFLAMNYPLLLLASHDHLIFGIPALVVYVFGIWALLILVIKRLISNNGQPESNTSNPSDNAQQ